MRYYALFFIVALIVNAKEVLGQRNFTLNDNVIISLPELSSDKIVGGEVRYPCFLNVRVYSNPSMDRPAFDIPVYALTERKGSYIGYNRVITDENGNACVMTLCYENALLLVETDRENALAPSKDKQHLHIAMNYDILYKQRGIKVRNVQNYGSLFGQPGPVYSNSETEKQFCENSVPEYFHFKYHFFGEPDILEENPQAIEYDPNTAWYPSFGTKEACFIKIQVQTAIFSTSIVAESVNARSEFWYGTAIASPKEGIDSATIKAACVEFRCPAVDDFNADIPTFLNASIVLPSGSSCNLTSMSDELSQKGILNTTDTAFWGTLTSNSNYGPNVGIYKNVKDPQDIARFSCYTGKNAFESTYEMNPEVGIALAYICQ